MNRTTQLKVIALAPPFPGHKNFFGPWVYRGDTVYVVDVGPGTCSKQLVSTLKAMNVDAIDYVFLTHIHIDHAGGLADLLSSYPYARVVCHSEATKHLVDPSALWAASRKALGSFAELYGQMQPVPKESIIPHTHWGKDTVEVIETPGHAPHHLSFVHDGILFVGEAGGHYQGLPDNIEYHRPATPQRFFFDNALDSVDRLLELEDMKICYAHYGMLPSSKEALGAFREQLLLWWDIGNRLLKSGTGSDMTELMVRALLKEDPCIQGVKNMDEDSRTREYYLMRNSARGFLNYIKEKPAL